MKKLLISLLVAAVVLTGLPMDFQNRMGAGAEVEASVILHNPKIVKDSSMKAGQKVTYDCIWFGSYPQSEITDEALCHTLAEAPETDWNENGDILKDGVRYRRLKRSDATHYYDPDVDGSLIDNHPVELDYYKWDDSETYHYFRYEPIKWRVLKVSGQAVFLMADRILDDQRYHKESVPVTWSESTLRSWMNGYAASENSCRIDFTTNNFLSTAFSANQKKMILRKTISNDDSITYGTPGGPDTSDLAYLLSESDVCDSDLAASYGFCQTDRNLNDEARQREGTAYAQAMGIYISRDYFFSVNEAFKKMQNLSPWLLRTPGADSQSITKVVANGRLDSVAVDNTKNGICPVLTISLTGNTQWTYAGTVCTDGKVDEDAAPELTPKKKVTITAGNQSVAINNKSAKISVKTNGDGKLTYTSSNPSVATVSAEGKITPKGYGETKVTIRSSETEECLSASKKITITIVPKKMVIKSVKSSAKKTLTLTWKKDKAASSYEIQLCRKKSFNTQTLSNRVKKTLTRQKITGMTSKTWYVRIRAYKKVKGKTCYGIWSTAKKKKVR